MTSILAMQGVLDCIAEDLHAGRATLPSETAEELGDGRNHAHHAVQVVANVMEFTKLKAGKLQLQSEPFALDALASSAVRRRLEQMPSAMMNFPSAVYESPICRR